MVNEVDKRAPMAAAPMNYRSDGSVDWGNMWDSFCELAQEGGPPHRGTMLYAQEDADIHSPVYQGVVAEIVRGIAEVSGLVATPAEVGWIAVRCQNAGMAHWLADAITQENVKTRVEGAVLFVPAGAYFSVKGEIKNVITAVAKTTHYWWAHVPSEVKSTLSVQMWVAGLKSRIVQMLGFRQA
jgi:sirohydrochlorin cobaltochelatase